MRENYEPWRKSKENKSIESFGFENPLTRGDEAEGKLIKQEGEQEDETI